MAAAHDLIVAGHGKWSDFLTNRYALGLKSALTLQIS